jgi:hypothetical protein
VVGGKKHFLKNCWKKHLTVKTLLTDKNKQTNKQTISLCLPQEIEYTTIEYTIYVKKKQQQQKLLSAKKQVPTFRKEKELTGHHLMWGECVCVFGLAYKSKDI